MQIDEWINDVYIILLRFLIANKCMVWRFSIRIERFGFAIQQNKTKQIKTANHTIEFAMQSMRMFCFFFLVHLIWLHLPLNYLKAVLRIRIDAILMHFPYHITLMHTQSINWLGGELTNLIHTSFCTSHNYPFIDQKFQIDIWENLICQHTSSLFILTCIIRISIHFSSVFFCLVSQNRMNFKSHKNIRKFQNQRNVCVS